MRSLLFFILITWSTIISAQNNPLTGYWKVETVTVGQDNMTPVAKWFHLGPTGDLQGGNGGNINLFGTWQSSAGADLLFTNQQGEADPAGPFAVEWNGPELILQREEEGQAIKVILEAFEPTDWPMAPWDRITGAWQVVGQDQMSENETVDYNTAFFRWDNQVLFNRGNDGVRVWTALWRINAHRPQLELARRGGDSSIISWNIEFKDEQMIWTRSIDNQEQRLVWEQQE